jgi:predicted secreted protein
MTLVTGIAVYVVVWWIVLFAVLPWGVRPPETLVPGQADSAPENPRLWLKAGVTTLIAAVIWAGIYFVVQSDWISFRDMAR